MAATEPDLDPTYPAEGILRQSIAELVQSLPPENPAMETLRAQLADIAETVRCVARLEDAVLLAPVVASWLALAADDIGVMRLPPADGAACLDDGIWISIAREAGAVVPVPDSATRAMVRVLLATGGE